jgi:hypothetical protein
MSILFQDYKELKECIEQVEEIVVEAKREKLIRITAETYDQLIWS